MVTVAAALTAIIVTSLLPSKYEATGILLPPRANDPESVITDPQFGYDIESDRLIQMLESETMLERVADANNLHDYYQVGSDRKDGFALVSKQFRKDVKIIRTRYMSVVIKARMKSPELAADVVNAMIDEANAVRNEVIRTGLDEQMENAEFAFGRKLEQVNQLGDSLYALSQMKGKEQVPLLYYRLRFLQGQSSDRESLLNLLNEQPLAMLQPTDEQLVVAYLFEQRQLENIRERISKISQRLSQPMSGVYVIDRARPNFRKVSPSFTINLAAAISISFFLTLVALSLFYRWRKIQAGT